MYCIPAHFEGRLGSRHGEHSTTIRVADVYHHDSATAWNRNIKIIELLTFPLTKLIGSLPRTSSRSARTMRAFRKDRYAAAVVTKKAV